MILPNIDRRRAFGAALINGFLFLSIYAAAMDWIKAPPWIGYIFIILASIGLLVGLMIAVLASMNAHDYSLGLMVAVGFLANTAVFYRLWPEAKRVLLKLK